MKRVILLVVWLLFITGGVCGQNNPFWVHEAWRVELDLNGDAANSIVSYWHTEHGMRYLISSERVPIIIDGNQIIWQGPDQQDFISSLNFGLAEGIGVVTASQGQLTYFYGENYEHVLKTDFQLVAYKQEDGWRTRKYDIKMVIPACGGRPDTLRRVILGIDRYADKDSYDDHIDINADGVYHLLSFSGNIDTALTEYYSPQQSYLPEVDNEDQDSLVVFGGHTYGYEDDHGLYTQGHAGLIKFAVTGSGIERRAIALEHYACYWVSDILNLPNGDKQIVAGIMHDDFRNRIVILDIPNFTIRTALYCDYRATYTKRWFVVTDPASREDYILYYGHTSNFQLFRITNRPVIDNFSWQPEGEIVRDFIADDFDGDGRDEFLVLTDGSLILYEINALNVTEKSFLSPPSSLSLAPFPNPFNASTTISYTLPRPGRYALDVVDIQGRLVTRLSDGWKEAGSYRSILQGGELPSGVFVVRLEGGNRAAVQKIEVVK